MSDQDLKKLLSIVSPREVAEICTPLFESFDLNSFIYTRVYKNNAYWTLSNRADWVQHFYCEKYAHPKVDFSTLKSGYYVNIEELGIPQDQIVTARECFNADYWLNIIKTHEKYYDVIALAGNRGCFKIIDMYLNNADLLEHFYYYFKDKAHRLIKQAEAQKIALPDKKTFSVLNDEDSAELRSRFLKNTPIERYHVLDDSGKGYVTQREYQIVFLLSQGKSTKEISVLTGLTPRTVKSYLYNAMQRLGCYNRAQLITLIKAGYAFK